MAEAISRLRNQLRQLRWYSFAIVVGSLLVVVAIDGFVAHILWRNRDEAVQNAEAENSDLAKVLEKYVLTNMQGIDLVITSTARAIEAAPALKEPGSQRLRELLQARLMSFPNVGNLAVMDRNGNVLASSRSHAGDAGQEVNVSERAYFQMVRDNPKGGLYIDVPRASRTTGELVIGLSRPLMTADGTFDGLVFASLTVASLRDFLGVVNVGRNGLVTLYRDDGTVLARVPAGVTQPGETYPNQPLFTTYLPRALSGSFEGVGLADGQIRHLSYRKIEGLPLVVTVARARGEFLANWYGQVRTYAVAAALFTLLILGLGIYLSHEMNRREDSERDLIEQEHLIRLVADNVPMLIAYVDRHGTYRFVNRVASSWMKRPIGDFAGHQVSDVLPAALFERAKPRIEAALRGINVGFEEKRLYGDGIERWADVTYVPVTDNAGPDKSEEVIGYIVLVADISGRKRAEAQLHEHEEQLRQSQKMEVVGQLTGGVAHDFNNLLGVILGNLDLLDSILASNPEAQRILQRAISAVERGGSLTRQLLAFSRKQVLMPQSLDVNHLLVDLAALLRRTLGESVEVETVAAENLWQCRADRTQLETAILNLALNARDAMPKGGCVTIDAANFVLDDIYASQYAEVTPGDYVALSVTDTGTGMSANVVERAFEPFFTTKEVGKGSGLGLSMVYGFVKQSGGHIRLYSEPDLGTTVKLFLPRATDGKIMPKPLPDPAAPRGAGQLILVVEDNLPLRQVAVISLNSLGYATLEATTVAEAITLLEQHDDIALLFTDIMLPGGRNGFDLADEARKRWPQLKILFASGHPNVAQSAESLAAGAVIVPKPFRAADLARHVRATLEG